MFSSNICIKTISKYLFQLQGEAIEAQINIREKHRFDATLEINKAYKITGYGFQPAKLWMQTVPHTLSLVFGNQTDIQPIPDVDFPTHYFRFTLYKDLYSRVDKKGLLTGISDNFSCYIYHGKHI